MRQRTTEDTAMAAVAPLLHWYGENARVLPWRETVTPYRVWISEIMLQQTRVEAVKPYYLRFLSRLPDVYALSQVEEGELMKLWEGLGYYSRARNLKKAARVILEQHGGELPADYETLLSLPGIGPYTAGAICSIAFGQRVPAVDGNVKRVFSRLTADKRDLRLPEVHKELTAALEKAYPQSGAECAAFTQSLMELGALVCLPNTQPLCAACPLRALCEARSAGTQTLYPVKQKKKPRPKDALTVLLLRANGCVAIHRRSEGGLLGGMWEYPNLAGTRTEQEVLRYLQDEGLCPENPVLLVKKTHIFTHREWDMTGILVDCREKGTRYRWVTPEELQATVSLPSAFGKFTEYLTK